MSTVVIICPGGPRVAGPAERTDSLPAAGDTTAANGEEHTSWRPGVRPTENQAVGRSFLIGVGCLLTFRVGATQGGGVQ